MKSIHHVRDIHLASVLSQGGHNRPTFVATTGNDVNNCTFNRRAAPSSQPA